MKSEKPELPAKPNNNTNEPFFSGSSELSVNNTNAHIANILNSSRQPTNSLPASSRNVINHFFSQVNAKKSKPIIKPHPIQPPDHTITQITIQELPQLSKANSISKNLSSKNVHFNKPNMLSVNLNSNSLNKLENNGVKLPANIPLKNITTIRSSSFRHKSYANQKLDLHKSTLNLNVNQPNNVTKDTTKSFENLHNAVIKEDSASQQPMHTINRLVKIASNWHSKSRSSSTSSNYNSPKIVDRGLMSQSKIRQAQLFIDTFEYANSESAMSRKMADIAESPAAKINSDDSGSDRKNRMRMTPTRILPNRQSDSSVADSTKNSSILESSEAYSNINYWKPNETSKTGVSDPPTGETSARNSFIFARSNSRSIELVNLNKATSRLARNRSFKAISPGNLNGKADAPQLSKLAQFAIEIQ
jgi:hypothetical protein